MMYGLELRRIIEYCRSHKNIYCYGAGLYGKIVCAFLYLNDICIDGFLISCLETEDSMVLNKKVMSIDETLIKGDGAGVLICVNNKVRQELINKLVALRWDDYLEIDDELINEMDNCIDYEKVAGLNRNNRVLLYHRVFNLQNDIWRLAVSPEEFERQIVYLKKHYDIVPLDELEFGGHDNQIAITFDDGYIDNYIYALPIIEKYQVPVTIFVATGNIGTECEFWWDEIEGLISNTEDNKEIHLEDYVLTLNGFENKKRACYLVREKILTLDYKQRRKFISALKEELRVEGESRAQNRTVDADELRQLDRSNWVTIGGHTVTHTRLTSQTEAEQRWEIFESKRILEKIIGHQIFCFSYPFGGVDDYDETTIELALEAGYKNIIAVGQRYKLGTQAKYCVPRIVVQNTGEDHRKGHPMMKSLFIG